MKVNVCVNGTFRYREIIRRYEEAGVLGAFYYAHRRGTTPASLGLRQAAARNSWPKEYALQAAWRALPASWTARATIPICDGWQRDVVRHWRDCDAVEAVTGAIADRVLDHAKRRGSRTLGHPVCAHPSAVADLVGRAYDDLGLNPAAARPVAMERRLAEIEMCDHLLVDSRYAARSFERAGLSAKRITICTPGVDTSRFHPRRSDDRDRKTFRVVCVGTLTPRKGQHLLLQAWRRLALPGAELVLVGPPGRDAAAVTRGFEGSFTRVSRVPYAQLRALLVQASVFVLVSVEDGFAYAPLEAMACGVPVIVSSNVGMADCVTDGRDGFVVPAFDVDALAACLEQLYRDSDLADGMGEAAARTAHRCGSWSEYAGQVVALHRGMEVPALSPGAEAA